MYKYDVLNRVTSQIQRAPGLAARTTWFEYDALGNTIKTTVQAGDLFQTTSSVFNLMGDLVSTTDAAGLTTRYAKDLKNRRSTTTTLTNGAIRVEDTYLDGQLRAVQGDAVIAEFYGYGVDKEDGHRWTLTRVAKPDGPRWSRSRVNALGQSIQSERPSPVADGSPTAPTGRDIPAQGNALGANDKSHASPEGARQPEGSPASLPLTRRRGF